VEFDPTRDYPLDGIVPGATALDVTLA